MRENLRELYQFRELLYMITLRDIKVRYKQSIMGFFWAVLMPLLIVFSGVLVRFGFATVSGSKLNTAEIVSVAVKSVPWSFLVSSIRFACNSLVGNRELVTKVYFPKEIFPFSAVLASFFDFLIASLFLIVILLFGGAVWSVNLLLMPLLLLAVFLLATGIGTIVSAASLFFRDVKYIVDVLLTFGIFFTPVFYDVSLFGPRGKWLLLNPAAPLLGGISFCITRSQPPSLGWILYSFAFAAGTTIVGYALFKRVEEGFAESI